jgi:hypothetical protein
MSWIYSKKNREYLMSRNEQKSEKVGAGKEKNNKHLLEIYIRSI